MKLTGTFTLILNDKIIDEWIAEGTDEGIPHTITVMPSKYKMITFPAIDTLEEVERKQRNG